MHPSQRALHTERRGLGIPQAKELLRNSFTLGSSVLRFMLQKVTLAFLMKTVSGGGVWRMEGERPLATAAIQKKGKGTLASRGQLTQEVFMCVCVFKREGERSCRRTQRGWGGGEEGKRKKES